MLVYRIEQKETKDGLFQVSNLYNVLPISIIHLYIENVYDIICENNNHPDDEAYLISRFHAYSNFMNMFNGKFGCKSIEQLLTFWCIDKNKNKCSNLFFETLHKCNFVLSTYKVSQYIALQTQIVYNSENAVLIAEESILEMLKC